jgi:serine/threonine-protein kinase ULK/ATG1
LHEVIGEGSFGTVFHATHASNSSHYAVKLIPITKYLTNNKLHQYTDNELKILSRIGPSTHIINFFELIKTDNYYYFVYEYCEGGTLMDLIGREGRLEEKKAMKIFRELLEAFKVLNKYNITHRDLKPENVFFSDGKVKLGDFGFCKELG